MISSDELMNNVSFVEAACLILRQVGEPLSANEITAIVLYQRSTFFEGPIEATLKGGS